MHCKSCKEDVPPKFAHALTVNICPLCGLEIMDVKLKNIISELKIGLEDAKHYMDEVEDWLYSNYSLKRVSSNQIVVDKNFYDELNKKASQSQQVQHAHGKSITVNRNDEQIEEDVVVDEKPSTVFAKRAGVPNSHKRALDFIKGRSMGAADPSEFQGIDDEYGDVNSGFNNDNPLNINEQNEMVNIFKQDDLSKASHELELQKLKKLQAQNAVSGGGGGFFRRT